MLNKLENIHESSEIILRKFPHADIKLFQTDVDEGWSDSEIILFHM